MQSSLNNREYASYRLTEYEKAYSNQDAHERASLERMFSVLPGSATTRGFPNYGVVLQLASLLANVSSFSGFLTIEKTIEQPNFVLHFLDLIGTNVRDNQQISPVFPTVGPTKYDNSAYGLQTYVLSSNRPTIDIDDDTFRNAAGIPLGPPTLIPPVMPYTIKIVVKAYSGTNLVASEVFTDNGNRILVNLGLSGGSIVINSPTPHISTYGNPGLPPNQLGWNFTVGGIPIVIDAAATGATSLEVQLSFAFNYTEPIYYPGQEQDERFTLNLARVVTVNTKPAKLTIELNKQELAAISKSMSQDLQPVIVQRVGEIYNKMVNRYIVRKYVQRFIDSVNFSNVVTIDLGSPLGGPAGTSLIPDSSFNQYIPVLDRMRGGFEKVRQELHRKSYIANKPTALLVSPKLAYFLAKSIMVEQSLWVEEKVTYINDLFGYYIGIPVLIHTELETLDAAFENWARNRGVAMANSSRDFVTAAVGFAVAILPDNNLAPMVRATFLPPTNTPTVANFNNPLQEAFSMFYQEEVDVVAPELVVPFGVTNMPVS